MRENKHIVPALYVIFSAMLITGMTIKLGLAVGLITLGIIGLFGVLCFSAYLIAWHSPFHRIDR